MRTSFFDAIKGGIMAGNDHRKDSPRNASSGEPPSRPASGRERPPEETIQPDPVARSLSVLGANVVFKGELSAEEDLLIHGYVEGSIKHRAASLTIGARGDVKADIVAQRIIVQGKVRGDIRASEAVIVEASAQVHGNIFAPRVALEEGARFSGHIDVGPAMQIEHGNRPEELGEPGVNELLNRARA